MQDAKSVITEVAKGIAPKMAAEMEISLARMYEILGKDNPYPKAKRLIRLIGKLNPAGARLIKADLDIMFAEIFNENTEQVTVNRLHREAFEAINALMENLSVADQLRELRELIAVASRKMSLVEQESQKDEEVVN